MDKEILSLLKDIDRKVDENSKKLDEHGRKLDEYGRKLDEHGRKLDEHGRLLRALEEASHVHKAEMDKISMTVNRIEGEVKTIREDLTAVELVTSKNWNDIVKLKSIK